MSLNPAGTILQPETDPLSQTTLIPHNQQPLVIRSYPSVHQLDKCVQNAAVAQEKWARVPLKQRIAIGRKFMVCHLTLHLAAGAQLRVCRKSSRR